MTLRNRVTPFGDIVAVAGRGTLMGNRGILHNAQRQIVRDSQVRRWIACVLSFRGRHRAVMQPGHYTELFFLDEAAALADGHRPCAECRLADYREFQSAWRRVYPTASVAADDMDAILHAERRVARFSKRTHSAPLASLPDGTYIALPVEDDDDDDKPRRAWLVLGSTLLGWSAERYTDRIPRPASGDATVLTPRSIVAVLRAGYTPALHPSSA